MQIVWPCTMQIVRYVCRLPGIVLEFGCMQAVSGGRSHDGGPLVERGATAWHKPAASPCARAPLRIG